MDEEKLLKLKKPLDDFIEYYERLTPRSVSMLDKLVVPGVRYKDPFNDVMGADAYQRIVTHMLEQADNLKLKVTDSAWGRDNTAYLRWAATFSMNGESRRIEGISEIMFSDEGFVMSHTNFWDAASNVYEHIPVLGALIRFVKSKLKLQ